MTIGISGLAYALPSGVLDHSELQQRFGSDEMDRLVVNTGITSRRVSLKSECASDLAVTAAEALFKNSNVDPSTIDFVIFATQMPDYLMPTTACILQNRLGISTSAGAFDINLGCSQYVYSHGTAYALVNSGLAKKVLVMTGDTPSRIVNPLDRAVVPLFGDAGTAAIIEDVGESGGFQKFAFGSDGSEYQSLIWPTSGMREKKDETSVVEAADKSGAVRSRNDMYMDGQRIFLFTLKTVPRTLKEFLANNNLSVDDIDFFVFHQASKLIVETIAKKMGIPDSKFNRIYETRGNSGGSTVGIALHHAVSEGRIKPGSKVVMSAFGVGLSWAHTVMIWPQTEVKTVAVE
jgi:3-oxoacyl-[acyl-carrier-protein] synthase-3